MNEQTALREQIAKAIHRNRFPDSTWERQPAGIQNDYLNCADAVLAAALPHTEEQLLEARMWARHGYEIGQKHCGWSDHGVAPAWLTEGWPRAFDSCEHLQQMAQFDEALTRVRAEIARWKRNTLEPQTMRALDDIERAMDGTQPPAPTDEPSTAEAAAQDRAHWTQKYAGE